MANRWYDPEPVLWAGCLAGLAGLCWAAGYLCRAGQPELTLVPLAVAAALGCCYHKLYWHGSRRG